MNNAVGLIFNESFVGKKVCESMNSARDSLNSAISVKILL